MPNEDEEPKIANLPGYQFFSTDLNYNYFGDQSASTPDLLATSAGSSSPNLLTTSAGSSPLDLLATNAGSSTPDLLTTSSVPSATSAPIVENVPARAVYSLTADEPEPTFEERVAAMEREIAAADAASAAARAAADIPAATPKSEISSASLFAPAKAKPRGSLFAPPQNLAPAPAPFTTPVSAPVNAVQIASAPAQSEPKWNQYVEPSVVPDVFSSTFNFNRSLLKIFWRIDIDHNNRVSKNELAIALQENWFEGDERVLAKLLYESYEDISPETIFCDAGLSVNNILSFGPFAEMAASQLESQIPDPVRPEKNARPAQKKSNNKSVQSLRSLFKR